MQPLLIHAKCLRLESERVSQAETNETDRRTVFRHAFITGAYINTRCHGVTQVTGISKGRTTIVVQDAYTQLRLSINSTGEGVTRTGFNGDNTLCRELQTKAQVFPRERQVTAGQGQRNVLIEIVRKLHGTTNTKLM